ncbi:MAG: hypothetical protein KF729_05740 [Sandaracinaceae bacterium]|nr:hypothetical protein [Sandaracinaceae bacterium]
MEARMATNDESVRINLAGLFEMEAQRRADEAAARERARLEAEAREERERRAHEAALRAARDDERARAEAEREAERVAVEARIARLREELAEVRAARETTQLELAARAQRADAAAPSGRGTWIAGGMAAMSLVAALGATVVAWPRAEAPVAPVRVQVVETPLALAPPESPAPIIVAEPAPPPPPVVEASPPSRPVARPVRPTRPRPDRPSDLASQLEFGRGDGLIPE